MRFINGEIVTHDFNYGYLAVLNGKLEVLKYFHGQQDLVRSLAGNHKYIAYGEINGTVNYYDRTGGLEPKVTKVFKGVVVVF